MTRDDLIRHMEIVGIDTDIVAACARIDQCEPGTLTMQRLGEMLDALMERKQCLLEELRATPPPSSPPAPSSSAPGQPG
jgi:hypothetical protein